MHAHVGTCLSRSEVRLKTGPHANEQKQGTCGLYIEISRQRNKALEVIALQRKERFKNTTVHTRCTNKQ